MLKTVAILLLGALAVNAYYSKGGMGKGGWGSSWGGSYKGMGGGYGGKGGYGGMGGYKPGGYQTSSWSTRHSTIGGSGYQGSKGFNIPGVHIPDGYRLVGIGNIGDPIPSTAVTTLNIYGGDDDDDSYRRSISVQTGVVGSAPFLGAGAVGGQGYQGGFSQGYQQGGYQKQSFGGYGKGVHYPSYPSYKGSYPSYKGSYPSYKGGYPSYKGGYQGGYMKGGYIGGSWGKSFPSYKKPSFGGY